MNFNHSCRKLLQEEPDPLHPIMPPINDSSTPLSAGGEMVRRPFPTNTNPFDTSMALTILVLLTALFFMTFFSFYIRRYSASDDSNSNPNSDNNTHHRVQHRRAAPDLAQLSKGLDLELIQSLPTFPYGGAAKHRIECSICLSDFEDGETVKVIPYCRHAFHPPCIDTWLASHVSCPLCRSTQLFDGVWEGVGGCMIGDGVGEESDGGNSWRSREVRITAGDLRRTCSYSSLQNHCASLPRNSSF